MKKKFVSVVLIGILAVSCLALFACGKSKKKQPQKPTEPVKEAVLADFEQWAPDFQILRLMESFGAVDVNTDENYVKSGKQSAKLYVTGSAVGRIDPYIYFPTKSEWFGFDRTDFKKVEKVTAWIYNATQSESEIEVGAITKINGVSSARQISGGGVVLETGWNEVTFVPDLSRIATLSGFEEFDGIHGVYYSFPKSGAETKADADNYYIDDVVIHYGDTEKPIEKVTLSKDESATKFFKGELIEEVIKPAIPLKDLQGKAIHFECKLLGDGQMTFYLGNVNSQGLIGGYATISKSGESVSATWGNLYPIQGEEGWYAWELNFDQWAGGALATSTAVERFRTETGNAPTTDVLIDMESFKVVEAYALTRDTEAREYPTGTNAEKIFAGEPMSAYAGKAFRFEFKPLGDGQMTFYVRAKENATYKSVIGFVTVVKSGDTVTAHNGQNGSGAKIGRIVDANDGWYAWEINRSDWHGSNLGTAKDTDIVDKFVIYKTTMPVKMYWSSVGVTDAYVLSRDEMATSYASGTVITKALAAMPYDEYADKAFQFEFKPDSSAAVGSVMKFYIGNVNSQGLIGGYVTVTKSSDGTLTADKGKIEAIEEGWFVWKMNCSEWNGTPIAEGGNTTASLFLTGSAGNLTMDVKINWSGAKWIDAFRAEVAFDDTAKSKSIVLNKIDLSKFDDKALYFEFKPTAENGTFGFYFRDESVTGGLTGTENRITATNGTLTVSKGKGKLVALEDGWYGYMLNRDLWDGSGFNNGTPTKINSFYTWSDFSLTFILDTGSIKAVEKYRAEVAFDDTAKSKSIVLNKIDLSKFDDKALYFEFKPTAENGTFGFYFRDESVMGGLTGTENRITATNGTLTVSKGKGKLVALEDGWYGYMLNRDFWDGSGFNNGTPTKINSFYTWSDFSLTFILDISSIKAVDAYTA